MPHLSPRRGPLVALLVALLLLACLVAPFLLVHTVYRSAFQPVHEPVFNRQTTARFVAGQSGPSLRSQRHLLGAVAPAYGAGVQFADTFEGLYGDISQQLPPNDPNWLQTGRGNGGYYAAEIWQRDAQSSEMALGANQVNVSDNTTERAPANPSVLLEDLSGGESGVYQTSTGGWTASDPLQVSFTADFEHQNNTTSLALLTPDNAITGTTALTDSTQEANYLGLEATPDGLMHLQLRTAGGTPTDLVPAFSYFYLPDEQRDYRLTITPQGATTTVNVTVEQFHGFDQCMEAGVADTACSKTWTVIASATNVAIPATWNAHVHFWGIGRGQTGDGVHAAFGRIVEVDPTQYVSYVSSIPAPTISSITNNTDPQFQVNYTTPNAGDPNIVGYISRYYVQQADGSYSFANQKYTMWAGQNTIQDNGIVPGKVYTTTVAPIFLGGIIGNASAPIQASDAAFNCQPFLSTGGFCDTFTSITETATMALDPNVIDQRNAYISGDSFSFVHSRHWMSTHKPANQFYGARSNLIQRARQLFDFTPTQARPYGTVGIDIDLHTYRRNWWDFGILGGIYNGINYPDFFHQVAPPQTIDLSFSGGQVNLAWVDTNGKYHLDYGPNFQGTPDYRNHLVLHVAKTFVDVYIDGNLFWHDPISINWSQGYSYVNASPYHPDIQTGVERTEFHYANWFFDGPGAGTAIPTFAAVYPHACYPGNVVVGECTKLDMRSSAVGGSQSFTMTVPANTGGTVTAATFFGQGTTVAQYSIYSPAVVGSVSVDGNPAVPLQVKCGSLCVDYSYTNVMAAIPPAEVTPGVHTFTIYKDANLDNGGTTSGFTASNWHLETQAGGSPSAPVGLGSPGAPIDAALAGAACPAGWSCQDIGAPSFAGGQTLAGSVYTLQGAGTGYQGVNNGTNGVSASTD